MKSIINVGIVTIFLGMVGGFTLYLWRVDISNIGFWRYWAGWIILIGYTFYAKDLLKILDGENDEDSNK